MKLRTLVVLSLAAVAASLGTRSLATITIEQPVLAERWQSSQEKTSSEQSTPNRIFDDIVPLLQRNTPVPLRLPEYVPYSNDKKNPLYSILDEAGPEGYSIQLAWLKDCNGGNACHVGYVGASKAVPRPSEKPRVPVTLSDGIAGSFVGSECDAHCDDASVSWTEEGYWYEISLKAGDKKTLIRMANSAIRKTSLKFTSN